MGKRLPALVLMLLASPAPHASAQVEVAVTAPASLVCDQTATASISLGAPANTFELMLVLDDSGSISTTEFTLLKTFASNIVQSLSIGPDQTRVGIVQFADTGRLVANLSASSTALLNAINAMPHAGGATCIGCGIALADERLEATARPDAARVMIVVTEGGNNVGQSTFANVLAAARSHGTVLIAVGVGSAGQTELNFIASDLPGVQTVFSANSFQQLTSLLNGVVAALVVPTIAGPRLTLTLSPEFTLIGAVAQQAGATATITGNTVEWSAETLDTQSGLLLDFRRTNPLPGAAPLFSSTAYVDLGGRTATVQNPTVALSGCDSETIEEEVERLQAQVAALLAQADDLEDEIAALGAERLALMDQIAILQAENAELRAQLENPAAPTGTGAINGFGQVVAGLSRNMFSLVVRKAADGNLKAALEFTVCRQQQGQADTDLRCLQKVHKLIPSLFTAVQFSDDAAFTPTGNAGHAGVDTVVVSGRGSWDGVPGYQFSVTATDRGDGAGPNTDTFEIVITAADGTVVASATGTLAEGNIEITES